MKRYSICVVVLVFSLALAGDVLAKEGGAGTSLGGCVDCNDAGSCVRSTEGSTECESSQRIVILPGGGSRVEKTCDAGGASCSSGPVGGGGGGASE